MDRPICVSVLVVVAEGRESEFLEVSCGCDRAPRTSSGVRCFHVSAAPDPRTYMFYEAYVDGDAVASHKKRQALRGVGRVPKRGGHRAPTQHRVRRGVLDRPGHDDARIRGARRRAAGGARQPSLLRAPRAGNASYDFESRDARSKARARTWRPRISAARAFSKEDPIRPHGLSEHTARGLRHMKKGLPHQISPQQRVAHHQRTAGWVRMPGGADFADPTAPHFGDAGKVSP